MANIQVADLNLSGSDLLLGEESSVSCLTSRQIYLTVESPFLAAGIAAAC